MITLLQEVFNRVSILSEPVQEMLARELLQEIEWEEKWDVTLSNSQSELDKLTINAMKKYKEGKTIEKGFDEL